MRGVRKLTSCGIEGAPNWKDSRGISGQDMDMDIGVVSDEDQVGDVLSGAPVSHGRGAWKMTTARALLETRTQEHRQSVGDVIRAAAAVANHKGNLESADDMYSLLRRKSSAAVFGTEERNTSPQHRVGAGPAIHCYTAHYTSLSSKGAGSFGSSNPVSPRQRRTILAVDGNGTLRLPSLPQAATHPGSQSTPNTPRHRRPPSTSPPLHRPSMSPPLHRPSMKPVSLCPSMSPTLRHGVRFPADAVPTSQARSPSPNNASYSSGVPPSPLEAVLPSPRRSQHERQLEAVYLCAVCKEPPPVRSASVWPGWSAGTPSPHAPSAWPSPYPCPGAPGGEGQTPAHTREGAKAKQRNEHERRLSMAYPQQPGPWVPVPETPRTALAL